MKNSKDLRRVGSGVYRIFPDENANETSAVYLSGRLHSVLTATRSRFPGLESLVQYLVTQESGEITWQSVNVRKHQHYHGPQQKLLLNWFYVTQCPLSYSGYNRFASITGVSAGRLKDALRRADTASYKPFSEEAMKYLAYRIQEWQKMGLRNEQSVALPHFISS